MIQLTPTGGETGSRSFMPGARLDWLLLPEERTVEIWPAAEAGRTSEPRRIEQAQVLDGGPEFPGLRLELGEIWEA